MKSNLNKFVCQQCNSQLLPEAEREKPCGPDGIFSLSSLAVVQNDAFDWMSQRKQVRTVIYAVQAEQRFEIAIISRNAFCFVSDMPGVMFMSNA